MNNPDIEGGGNSSTVATAELRSFLERVERLQEEQAALAEDIKTVKAEAKAKGHNMKAFSAMLSLRKKDEETRQMIGVYADALDIFS
jgi:uncharacterized protein (UPF0335 family)